MENQKKGTGQKSLCEALFVDLSSLSPVPTSERLMLMKALALGLVVELFVLFAGHSYSSCIACHANGNGSGPLSDYGRALWSAEIASRALYPKSMTDEELGAQSGFLGKVELPAWFRPHIKYRGIDVNAAPGTNSQTDAWKFYQMQADFGATVQDSDSKYVGVVTFGRVIAPSDYGLAKQDPLDRVLAREYYIRYEADKSLFIYAGLLERVYGIRNIDHTSFQRSPQGFGIRNNTVDGIANSHGIIIQKDSDHWGISLGGFMGNPYDDAQFKQSGASVTGEYEIGENKRIGASALTESSQVLAKNMGAIHYRQQIFKGSSLIFEWGMIQDKTPTTEAALGSYNLLQTLILLTRGYNFKATIERYNKDFNPSTPDQWKWSLGFLMFPMPRLELRTEILNVRTLSSQRGADDGWAAQGQIHVSL